jgi:hypothetical protein
LAGFAGRKLISTVNAALLAPPRSRSIVSLTELIVGCALLGGGGVAPWSGEAAFGRMSPPFIINAKSRKRTYKGVFREVWPHA